MLFHLELVCFDERDGKPRGQRAVVGGPPGGRALVGEGRRAEVGFSEQLFGEVDFSELMMAEGMKNYGEKAEVKGEWLCDIGAKHHACKYFDKFVKL